MRTLDDLINDSDSALPILRERINAAGHSHEILSAADDRARVLLGLQVTTRSTMGAVAYETGGLLIDHGWLRILGSGHPRLHRNLLDWNAGKTSGHLLVADDVVGGFFALNSGGLGDDSGAMYYWAPDTLTWESLAMGYSDFVSWSCSSNLAVFYSTLRWKGWESDVASVSADHCYNFYPFLWTQEGSIENSSRKTVGIEEQYSLNVDLATQIN